MIIMQKYSPNVFLPELLGPADESTTILQNVEKYLLSYKAEYFRILESFCFG